MDLHEDLSRRGTRPTARLHRPHVLRAIVTIIAIVLLAGACDDSGDDSGGSERKTTTTKDAGKTTATENEEDEDATTTTKKSSTTTTTEGVTPDVIATDGTGTPWTLTAGTYVSDLGNIVQYTCPANGTIGSVWGTDTYTSDSSVCSAAVHAGIITVAEGGTVMIEITEGMDSYLGTTANGVKSESWAQWDASFTFR